MDAAANTFLPADAGLLLDLRIAGEPVGKGRPKFARMGDAVVTRTPGKTRSWERTIAVEAGLLWGARPPLDEPLALSVVAVGARPKSMLPKDMGGSAPKRNPPYVGRLWRPTKPDGDNVIKLVADAIVAAGVVRDDTRIVDWSIRCVYAALDEGPATVIHLWRVGDRP